MNVRSAWGRPSIVEPGRMVVLLGLLLTAGACGGGATVDKTSAGQKPAPTKTAPVDPETKAGDDAKEASAGDPVADDSGAKPDAGQAEADAAGDAGDTADAKVDAGAAEDGDAAGAEADTAEAAGGETAADAAGEDSGEQADDGGDEPADPKALLKEVRSRRTKDDRAEAALAEAEAAGASDRDLAKAAKDRGDALFATPERAAKFYAWAADKDPNYPDATFELAKQAATQGDLDKTKELLKEVHKRKGKKLLSQLDFDPMWEIVKDDPEIKPLYR